MAVNHSDCTFSCALNFISRLDLLGLFLTRQQFAKLLWIGNLLDEIDKCSRVFLFIDGVVKFFTAGQLD